MDSYLVSCIVPVYNGERYLADAVESIFAQTYNTVEVIIVDDGSTDNTASVMERFVRKALLVRQENQGTPSARNTGIEHARGNYIGFLDADDLWHPEKLARQIKSFDTQPQLRLSFTFIQNFWSPEVSSEKRSPVDKRMRPVPGYVCPTMLVKRELFDRVGLFDVSLKHASEPNWIMKAAELGVPMELLPEVLVRRRLHPHSRSAQNIKSSHDEYLHLLKLYLDRRRAGKRFQYDFSSHTDRSNTTEPDSG